MSRILMLLPNADFDPTEAGVPWDVVCEAGHEVFFATEDGSVAVCDQITLSGDDLTGSLKTLAVRPENRDIYQKMSVHSNFKNPMAWHDVKADEYDGLILPGGHAPGMKPYLESQHVHDICRSFFARSAPTASICHGILALARTQTDDQKSILHDYTVTGLNNFQEKIALKMTKKKMGFHYRTYPETVQDEVSRALDNPKNFKAGPLLPAFGTATHPHKGFVVIDKNLVSARWPGDAYKLAHAFCDLLNTSTVSE